MSCSIHPESCLNPLWNFQAQDYACSNNRPFYPSSLPFSLLRQIISCSLSAWQGKCSNQTLLWAIIAHNNRGFWWLYQTCIRRFPFKRRTNYFSLTQSFGIYVRKAENQESKWRDKTITSPVTHNSVIYHICCLNWNALVADYQGFQHDFQGLSWVSAVYKHLKILLYHSKFKSCPELHHFKGWFCQDLQKTHKDRVEEAGVPAPSEKAWETTQSSVGCFRAVL